MNDTYRIIFTDKTEKKCTSYWSLRRWLRNNDWDTIAAIYHNNVRQNHEEFLQWLMSH